MSNMHDVLAPDLHDDAAPAMAKHSSPLRVQSRRVVGIVALAGLSLGFASACGSDESAEDAFCDAGDSLRSNIETIGDIDILAGGTDAVSERFEAIESDLAQLEDSGSDVAADEISALDSAVNELGSALEALGGGVSVEDAQQLGTSITAVVSAAGDVLERLSTTCS
jgi:hypothetical protein